MILNNTNIIYYLKVLSLKDEWKQKHAIGYELLFETMTESNEKILEFYDSAKASGIYSDIYIIESIKNEYYLT